MSLFPSISSGGGGGDDLLSCSEETRSSWLWCAGTRMGGGRRRGLETGEDACRWTVRWREGELGTRAYDHAAVKGGRAGATDAGRGRGVHSWH
jgi:hypothetical protein